MGVREKEDTSFSKLLLRGTPAGTQSQGLWCTSPSPPSVSVQRLDRARCHRPPKPPKRLREERREHGQPRGHADPCGGGGVPIGAAPAISTAQWSQPSFPAGSADSSPAESTEWPRGLHRVHLQAEPTGKGPQISAPSAAWHPALRTLGAGSELPPTHTPKTAPEKTGLPGQSRNRSSQGLLIQDEEGLRLPPSPGLRPSQARRGAAPACCNRKLPGSPPRSGGNHLDPQSFSLLGQ